MKKKRASTSEHFKLIDSYKTKPLEVLKLIKAKWAYGVNADKLLDFMQHPKEKEFTTFLVSTTRLVMISDFGEVNPNVLFTGDSINDYRVGRILWEWDNKRFIDPPSIGITTNRTCPLSFSDGRHRTKVSFLLDFEQIPISIANYDIIEINKMIDLQ